MIREQTTDLVRLIYVDSGFLMVYAPTWAFPCWEVRLYRSGTRSETSEWIVPGTLIID